LGAGSTANALRITGPVRLWVEAWDAASSGSRLAPYRLAAGVDGRTGGGNLLRFLDWTWAREAGWTFSGGGSADSRRAVIALDAPPGDACIWPAPGAMGEDLDPGSQHPCHRGWDAAGNQTRATCSLVRREPTTASTIGMPVRRNRFTSRGNFLEIHLRGREPERVQLRGMSPSGESSVLAPIVLRARGGIVLQLARPEPAMPGLWTFFAGDSLLGRALWIPVPGESSLWPISSLEARSGGLRPDRGAPFEYSHRRRPTGRCGSPWGS